MNPLDTKPFRGELAGKGAKTKQHFRPNSNLSGFGKGSEVTAKNNKLAMPVVRSGSSTGKLVKRTYSDAPSGLQGGLKETMKLLNGIKLFCERGTPKARLKESQALLSAINSDPRIKEMFASYGEGILRTRGENEFSSRECVDEALDHFEDAGITTLADAMKEMGYD
jgi:hypothetical protein